MSAVQDEAYHASMARLRERFLQRAREDLDLIERIGTASCASHGELRATVHRLAGSAGLFGFQALTDAAADLDERLAAGLRADPERVERLVSELRLAIAATNPSSGTQEPDAWLHV